MMFFYFLKIIFDISTLKRSKRYKPHSILAKKKKKLKFAEKQVEQQSQTLQLKSIFLTSILVNLMNSHVDIGESNEFFYVLIMCQLKNLCLVVGPSLKFKSKKKMRA